LISIFLGYAILFFDAILPSIITALGNKNIIPGQSATNSYVLILKNSWVANTLKTAPVYLDNLFSQLNTLNTWHELVLARFFWILVTIEVAIIFFIANRRLWNAFKNNLRIERVVYWFIIATIGIIINQKLFGDISLQNPVNFISLLLFFMLIALNIWLAVFINDAEDIEIDMISNPNRPFVKKEISKQEWHLMQIIFLILIALGLATLNNATAFLLLFAQAAYYIYSVRPLRLKRHFLFSSILIGVGVEIIVPIQSPNIEKIELVKRAKVRQGKLYFIREKSAKSLKMKYKDLAAVAKVEEEKEVSSEPIKETVVEEIKEEKTTETK